jgi:hypothetical protein
MSHLRCRTPKQPTKRQRPGLTLRAKGRSALAPSARWQTRKTVDATDRPATFTEPLAAKPDQRPRGPGPGEGAAPEGKEVAKQTGDPDPEQALPMGGLSWSWARPVKKACAVSPQPLRPGCRQKRGERHPREARPPLLPQPRPARQRSSHPPGEGEPVALASDQPESTG